MKSIRLLTFAAAVATWSADSAHAEHPRRNWRTADPVVNQRQDNQQDRIAQGVRSGELTRHETRVLAHKEAELARLEARLKSDGKLTPQERARLQHRLDALSKEIYQQKHDAQDRN